MNLEGFKDMDKQSPPAVFCGMLWSIHTNPESKVMEPTWRAPGADRTQVVPMLAPWTLLSGKTLVPEAGI